MLDTNKHYLEKESASGTDLLAEIPKYLTNVTEHSSGTQVYISGHCENYRVNIFQSGIYIIGSHAKYWFRDHNFNTLMRQDIKLGFEKLSDTLHLPIPEAKLTRLDFAQTFMVDFLPKIYFKYLGDCHYYQRLLQPTSLYYQTKEKKKLFYDKITESKSKGYKIPDIWQGSNAFRYEYRLIRRLPQKLNMPEVKVKHLFDEQVYMKLINLYVQEYDNITKLRNYKLSFDNMKTPNDFIKQLALISIQKIGVTEINQIIEEMRDKQVFDNTEYYSRCKSKIKELVNLPEITESSELIEELNQKIRSVKENYR